LGRHMSLSTDGVGVSVDVGAGACIDCCDHGALASMHRIPIADNRILKRHILTTCARVL
jgi:hypothetical protein